MRTPRDCSQCRSPPATTLSTTSLTVPPKAFLISLNSDSSLRISTSRRCGPIGTFSGVSGAGFRPAHATSATPSTASRATCSDVPGSRRRPQRPPRERERQLHQAADPARGERCRARLGLRRPRLALVRQRRRHGIEVEQHGREVDPRHAVDQRVMGLRDQREAAVVESLHEPQLPQRLRAVEPLRVDAGGERAQLVLGAGLRQRGVAQVVLEVEARVVDPHRSPGLDRRERELLAVAGDEVQPPAHVVGEVVERRRRALEDHDGADVHVGVLALLCQERRVHRRQPIAVRLRHVPLPRSGRPQD